MTFIFYIPYYPTNNPQYIISECCNNHNRYDLRNNCILYNNRKYLFKGDNINSCLYPYLYTIRILYCNKFFPKEDDNRINKG